MTGEAGGIVQQDRKSDWLTSPSPEKPGLSKMRQCGSEYE